MPGLRRGQSDMLIGACVDCEQPDAVLAVLAVYQKAPAGAGSDAAVFGWSLNSLLGPFCRHQASLVTAL